MADPGFLNGGAPTRWGRQPPTQALFGGNVHENERLGRSGSGSATGLSYCAGKQVENKHHLFPQENSLNFHYHTFNKHFINFWKFIFNS